MIRASLAAPGLAALGLTPLGLAALGLIAALPAAAQEYLTVTATRSPETLATVPATIAIVTGAELAARHATTLRAALALVPGVEAPPGGDTGPAGAVPAFWGLREFDAFLLVVDGVPWGGAFNPAIPSLDLTNVERIEVLKGAAPVFYGATAFVGVIQVVHNAAGRTKPGVSLGGGDRGSARGTVSVNLPPIGTYAQSLSLRGQSVGLAESAAGFSQGNATYRGAGALASGSFRIDADVAFNRQNPTSPIPRQEEALTVRVPRDGNANPADARIDENRYHGVIGASVPTPVGVWDSTVSLAYTDGADVRGFLRPELTPDPPENADSQNQRRHILDLYADTHVTTRLPGDLTLVWGADLLYGQARQTSVNGAYFVPLDLRARGPATTTLHIDEVNAFSDERIFAGQYAQATWRPWPGVELQAGARLNETQERLRTVHLDGFDPAANEYAVSTRHTVRGTFAGGVSWRPLPEARAALTLYADARSSFKPAAIDFGPDNVTEILRPERAVSVELGARGSVLDGRLQYGAELFQLEFRNLVVATTDAAGEPALENAGAQRLRGVEAELGARPLPGLLLRASGSFHDSRFTDYRTVEEGEPLNAAGRLLPLSPRWLASLGAIYDPGGGPMGSAVLNHVGSRYLDIANGARARAYTTIDASIGWRWKRVSLMLNGTNLTDERPAVTESEFGDSSYYLLPARAVFLDLSWEL